MIDVDESAITLHQFLEQNMEIGVAAEMQFVNRTYLGGPTSPEGRSHSSVPLLKSVSA